MKKEYIYLNINPGNEKVIKVGKTTKKPILRAKEMDRKSYNVNDWVIEKYWEVFDCTIAEKIAHYSLQEYHIPNKRELFEIDKEKAIEIIDKNMTVFSCSMNKENIENTYFENKKYVVELEAKIQDLEGALKVASVLIKDTKDNTKNKTETIATKLASVVEMLLENDPNNKLLLHQRDTYDTVRVFTMACKRVEGNDLLDVQKIIAELELKVNPYKTNIHEQLLTEKQDISKTF